MAQEIERKFLVTNGSYRTLAVRSLRIEQGYLASYDPATGTKATVRVRIAGNSAFLTVKSPNHGAVRGEWEYEIPVEEAREMLPLCAKVIRKRRYFVPSGDLVWEVDEFAHPLAPLVIAEVELPSATTAILSVPPFVGTEVTGDPEYYNSNIANRL